jgi:prepilin-type N-terminal cleavage/methylation domain-containing protein
MKRIAKKSGTKKAAYSAVVATKAGFTIIELLTVMSIIVILIGLLVPALNMAKRYAKTVRQRAQFHSIDAAIELFSNEFEGYPPSNALDSVPTSYCGAMKLCEAMMGQDSMGFHTSSIFRSDGRNPSLTPPYDVLYPDPLNPSDPVHSANLKTRKGPFLPRESADVYKLEDLYGSNITPFTSQPTQKNRNRVLCDVYTRQLPTGIKAGMPILYYKADTANNRHDLANLPASPDGSTTNIYNIWDNQELVKLGKVTARAEMHALLSADRFYKNTKSDKVTTVDTPYRPDSYILISAGYDGEYGTADDIFNFEWKYRD